jgi:hypothetical protein
VLGGPQLETFTPLDDFRRPMPGSGCGLGGGTLVVTFKSDQGFPTRRIKLLYPTTIVIRRVGQGLSDVGSNYDTLPWREGACTI